MWTVLSRYYRDNGVLTHCAASFNVVEATKEINGNCPVNTAGMSTFSRLGLF